MGNTQITDAATGNKLKVNSDGSFNIGNGNANGQSTMANSSPVAIASNQTGIGTVAAPNVGDTWISQAIRNGQGYLATYGKQSTSSALKGPVFSMVSL